MFKCHVCGSTDGHEELVSEVFQIDGKPVLAKNIPA
jgi:HTH-type transcriptional regulator/antitoxin MqsA